MLEKLRSIRFGDLDKKIVSSSKKAKKTFSKEARSLIEDGLKYRAMLKKGKKK